MGDHAKQGDAHGHKQYGDEPPAIGHRIFVPIADGRDGGKRPPRGIGYGGDVAFSRVAFIVTIFRLNVAHYLWK